MSKPLLSIIVIAYDMPRQALNTLRSLAPGYQRNVRADDYEVILVENRSHRNMDVDAISGLPGNFRYFLRDEQGVSPAAAINFGFSQARGDVIGLMIDGARMVTPGVIEHALMAFRITSNAMVVVPGYNLGEHEQQFHLTHGYSEEKEIGLLESIDWHNNGYRLFDISCLSAANPNGVFSPFMECNCLFISADVFRDIGQADERFDLPGGGALNLYIYGKVALHPQTRLFMLAGEGSFHQLHGGVTTSEKAQREESIAEMRQQLNELLGYVYTSPNIEPTILGKFSLAAMRYLQLSVERGTARLHRFLRSNKNPYSGDSSKQAAP